MHIVILRGLATVVGVRFVAKSCPGKGIVDITYTPSLIDRRSPCVRCDGTPGANRQEPFQNALLMVLIARIEFTNEYILCDNY